MKLFATLKNERGGKKTTSDDTRIEVELVYKNKIVGTLGLYSITEKGNDIGYRVKWDTGGGYNENQIIADVTCQHIIKTAEYESQRLQGYRCNACYQLVPVNEQYKKGGIRQGT